uniref:Uncharacterized protein n=1 Tax=Zea mays TaxID=4577 RepID=B6U572_MAIZE|nr:hypothetical protein [Zea mays]
MKPLTLLPAFICSTQRSQNVVLLYGSVQFALSNVSPVYHMKKQSKHENLLY